MNKKFTIFFTLCLALNLNAKDFLKDFTTEKQSSIENERNAFSDAIEKQKVKYAEYVKRIEEEKETERKNLCLKLSKEFVAWLALQKAAFNVDESPEIIFWFDTERKGGVFTHKKVKAFSLYTLNDAKTHRFATSIENESMKQRVESLVQNEPSDRGELKIEDVIKAIASEIEISKCSIKD